MRLALPAILLSLSLLPSAPAQSPAQTLPNADSIRHYYESGLKSNGILGSSLTILQHGQVVFSDHYGLQNNAPRQPVDAETAFHWASCTKSLTGIAILQLRDRGLLSLDDPLIRYIPELAAAHNPFGPINQPTIRDVMSHSGGFRDPTWPWRDDAKPWQPFEPTQWSQLVAMMPYTEVAFKPGSRFSYSNLGVVFLGEIIERLSGDSYPVYMEKNILRPLAMTHSYFDRSPYFLLPHRSHSWDLKAGHLTEDEFNFNTGITRSNGGLNAPIPDMLNYLNFLLGDPANPTRYDIVLKRASLEEMWQPILPVPPDEDFQSRPGASDQVATSFFLHTDGNLKLIGHAGWQNGFRSHFYLDPATRNAYLVAYNTDALDEADPKSTATAPPQNTRTFDFQLRDYLIDHIFHQP